MKKFLFLLPAICLFASCVSKKLLTQSQLQTANLRQDSARMAGEMTTLQGNIATLQGNVKDLNEKIAGLSSQNSQLGQQTANQQSQLTASQQALKTQQQKLEQLQALLSQQQNQSEQLKNKMLEELKHQYEPQAHNAYKFTKNGFVILYNEKNQREDTLFKFELDGNEINFSLIDENKAYSESIFEEGGSLNIYKLNKDSLILTMSAGTFEDTIYMKKENK